MSIQRPQSYEVVIVGAGIIGSAIFRQLSRNKVSTCLVDRGRFGMCGATGAAGGLVRVWHDSDSLTRLAAQSYQEFVDSMNFDKCGALYLADHAEIEQRSGLLQELNQQYEIGLRVLDNKELQASFPGLISGAGDECAVYEPHSGYINPVDYVAMWVNEGRAAGGVALETTNVASLLRHGNRVAGISTSIGEIHAQHVIIAAGAWTPGLMQAEGLETTIRTKGIQVNLIKKAAAFPHPIVIDERTGFFTRPARNDISFAGTTIQDWGRSPDKDIFASPSDETLAALAARFPWLNRGELSGARCAVDAYTPDGNGITDWVDGVKDLYIASGWSGCGIKVAPAVATHVANEILNTQAGKSDVE